MFKRFFSELRLYLCNEWVSVIPSHRFRLWYYRKIMGFIIGKQTSIFMHCGFDSMQGLTIGNTSVINAGCRIDTRGQVIIGENVSVSQEVLILTADHDADTADFAGRVRDVIIEDYVWIGTRATILPGVIIGKGALIAAGTVVTKSVDPFSVVAGVPGKVIRMRRADLNYQSDYRRLFQ